MQIITIDYVKKTRIKYYRMQMSKFAKDFRTWGEAGTVKSGKDRNLGDRRITMIIVGYAKNHKGNVYQMLNLKTGQITETRDIVWMFCMYYENVNSETTRNYQL